MADKKNLKEDAKRSLTIYYAELRQKRFYTMISALVLAVCVAFFIMLISGDTFDNALNFFGLKAVGNPKTGVYADCDNPVNKDNAICSKHHYEMEKTWKSLGSDVRPFSLSDR